MGSRLWLAAACAVTLALLLPGCLWQVPTNQGNQLWFGGWGWEGLFGAALIITALLLALGYMAGSLLANEQMKAWVRKEAGQLGYSVIAIVVILALVSTLDSALRTALIGSGDYYWRTYIENAVCCDPGATTCLRIPTRACHIEVAFDYLQMMYENLKGNAVAYFNNYYFDAFLSNLGIVFTPRMLPFIDSLVIRPLAGLSMGAEFFSILFDLTTKNMGLLRLQQIFIDYVVVGFFPIMLPLGLIMRIFYFTRKLGGTLIALSLSMYYVFPMFYAVSDLVFFKFLGPFTSATPPRVGVEFSPNDPANAILPWGGEAADFAPDSSSVFEADTYDVMDYCGTSTDEERAEQQEQITGFQGTWEVIRKTSFFRSQYDFITLGAFAQDGPIASLSAIMVFTLILPFLALMASLATFKVLSPMLGGDIEIALISRLL